MGISLEQLKASTPLAIQQMNPHIFGEVKTPLPVELSKTCKPTGSAFDGPEKELQQTCEAWLELKGYGRRTPKRLQTHFTGKWFLHFPQAKGNPIVLDLILLDATTGAYVEIELKVESGSLSPDQNSIIMRKEGMVCWSFEQFKQAVLLWEQAVKERTNHARVS